MKRKISIVLVVCMVLTCMTSCNLFKKDEIKEELLTYVNKELLTIKTHETKAVTGYNTLVQSAQTLKKEEIQSKLDNEIITEYQKFVDGLEKIELKTEEVKKCRDTYLEGAKKQLEGLQQLSEALKNDDQDLASKSDTTIAEGEKNITKHKDMVLDLAKKHNVKVDMGTTESESKDATTTAAQK